MGGTQGVRTDHGKTILHPALSTLYTVQPGPCPGLASTGEAQQVGLGVLWSHVKGRIKIVILTNFLN